MKKLILFAAILFAGVSVVNGQSADDNTTLNVKLSGLQAITVKSDQKTVNLVLPASPNQTTAPSSRT